MDELIEEMAEKHGTDADLLRELLEWERERVHLKKRRNKNSDLREIIERRLSKETL